MKKYFSLSFLLIFSLLLTVKATENPPKHLWTAKNPFEQKVFIENLGQYALKKKADAKDILFGARQDGMQYFFTKDGLWIKHTDKVERTKREMEKFKKQIGEDEEADRDGEEKEDNIVKYKFVDRYYRMEFVGAGAGTTFLTEDKVSQYFAFYTADKVNVQAKGFKKITYKNLYPNIDMEFYFPEDKQGFKYNLILHPGADLSQIKINYPINENISLVKEGNIIIKSIFGDFTDHAPIANDPKTNKPLACSFVLNKNTVSFSIPTYNKAKGVIIDPWTSTPVFAGSNTAYDVDWDIAGNCYAYGGISPYQLVKFSPAGVQLWTYTNTFSSGGGGSYYGDFAVNRLSGSAFVVDGFNGSGAGCEKVNLTGGFAVSGTSNSLFQEMWRIVYSRCTNQVVIAGGGTTNPSYTGATFDTSLSTGSLQIANVINSTTGLHDMWGVSIDAFGSAYFATAKTQYGSLGYDNYIFKVPTPALVPITYSVATTYSFVEVASIIYPGFSISMPNGYNGMAMSNRNLYTYDSYSLQKWNSVTGVMTSQANIGGASQTTMTYGGLAADECDHVFLGYNNTIKQYNGVTMTQTNTMAAANTVYDVSLGANNILYSCGNGFVSATLVNLPQCTILQVHDSITNGTCTNPVGSATLNITGGTPAYNITWNTSPVQTGTVVSNLSAGTYIATITDNSCPPLIQKDTIVVTSSNGFAVTPVITSVKCNGGNNGALSITTTGTIVPTYTWSPGGSNASGISNLIAGTYTVVMTGGGCNTTLGLTVTQPPVLSYTLSPGTLKCYGDTTSISVAVSGGTPHKLGSAYTVTWNPPNSTGFAVHGLGNGNYGATVVDSLGCMATYTVGLTQPAQVVPNFTLTPACFGSAIQFTDQSNGGPFASWSWNYGDGSALGTTQNPSYTYAATGTYTVALTPKTLAGCSATVTHTLTVFPAPTANFRGDTLAGCPVRKVNFKDSSTTVSGQIVTWDWNFGNGQTFTGQYPPTISYNNNSHTLSSTYTVSLVVTSNNGCSSTVVKKNYVTVYPRPQPGFTYASDDGSMIDVLNNTVHFYAQALGATGFHYYLGDIFATPLTVNYTTNPNPIHQYAYGDPYTYYITQVVANQYGCKDSVTEPLIIHPVFTFFVPTSFSPNGDGLNEYFKGTGIGIDNTTYSFFVYDRWGNPVFKTNDLEKAWDGRINNKGDVVLEDMYVWKAKFKDTMGQSHEYHGIVSIVK